MLERKYNMTQVDTSFIPDLPATGPLTVYRKRANFDWKVLRLILETEQGLRIKVSTEFIYKFLFYICYIWIEIRRAKGKRSSERN